MSKRKPASAIARLDRALQERETARRFAADRPEGWREWWEAAADDPALAALLAPNAVQAAGTDHNGAESGLLATHVNALRESGFAEVGTLWQCGDNRLLCAVR